MCYGYEVRKKCKVNKTYIKNGIVTKKKQSLHSPTILKKK